MFGSISQFLINYIYSLTFLNLHKVKDCDLMKEHQVNYEVLLEMLNFQSKIFH